MRFVALLNLIAVGCSLFLNIQDLVSEAADSENTIVNGLQSDPKFVFINGCRELFNAWMKMTVDPSTAPSPINCCDFHGVFCKDNQVEKLLWSEFHVRTGRRLIGEVPYDLLQVASHVDISKNFFTSFEPWPPSQGFKATVLKASQNLFTELPDFNFVSIWPPAYQMLDLSANLISAKIGGNNSDFFRKIGKPQILNLANNSISGYLLPYGELTWISVENNQFTEMGDFSLLPNLIYLNIANNSISSKFHAPKIQNSFPKLRGCVLTKNPDLCYDDATDRLPEVCSPISICGNRNRQPWEVCRKGIDECASGYTCCVGIDDVQTGITTCRWKGAIGQAHGCISE